jgi:ribose transport system substrate-binding protein
MRKGMPMARKLGILGIIAVLSFAIVACGDDGGNDTTASGSGGSGTVSDEGESFSLAYFGVSSENSYTQYMYKAAEQKAEEMGASIEFFDGKFDGATQLAQIQDATTSGRFDGFLVMPNDPSGIVPVVEQAIADSIKVAALQFPIGSDPIDPMPQVEGLTTSVIEDVIRGAEVTAEGVNAMCEGLDPCEVGLLWGAREIGWEAAKEKPFEETIEPNVDVVAEADGGFLQGPGEKATAAFLQSHPDLDVLASPSGDQMILGGQRAIEAADIQVGIGGRPDDAIALIGYGASKAGVERIDGEQWYQSYVLVPESMGEKAVELLVDELNGETLDQADRGIVQTEISPVGDNVTLEVLKEHPGFKGQWEG